MAPAAGAGDVRRAFSAKNLDEEVEKIMRKVEEANYFSTDLEQYLARCASKEALGKVKVARAILKAWCPQTWFLSPFLAKSPEFVADVLSLNGQVLRLLPEYQGNKALVLAAVRSSGSALQFASPELRSDPETVLAAVNSQGCALEFAHQRLRQDREFVLKAVGTAASALRFASATLHTDKEVVLAALSVRREKRSANVVINLTDQRLREDPDIFLAFVQAGGRLEGYEPQRCVKEFLADLDFAIRCFRACPDSSAADTFEKHCLETGLLPGRGPGNSNTRVKDGSYVKLRGIRDVDDPRGAAGKVKHISGDLALVNFPWDPEWEGFANQLEIVGEADASEIFAHFRAAAKSGLASRGCEGAPVLTVKLEKHLEEQQQQQHRQQHQQGQEEELQSELGEQRLGTALAFQTAYRVEATFGAAGRQLTCFLADHVSSPACIGDLADELLQEISHIPTIPKTSLIFINILREDGESEFLNASDYDRPLSDCLFQNEPAART